MNRCTVIFSLPEEAPSQAQIRRVMEAKPLLFDEMIKVLAAEKIWLSHRGWEAGGSLRMDCSTDLSIQETLHKVHLKSPAFLQVKVKDCRGNLWKMKPKEKQRVQS